MLRVIRKLNLIVMFVGIGLAVFFSQVGFAETMSVKVFLERILGDSPSSKTFSMGLDQGFYSAGYNHDYVGVTAPRLESSGNFEIAESPAYPGKIQIFNRHGWVRTVDNSAGNWRVTFLPNNMYYLTGKTRTLEMYDTDGRLLHSFRDPDFSVSPAGDFVYTKVRAGRVAPLKICEWNGDIVFSIPTRLAYQVNATGNGELVVLEGNTLSLWDVPTESKIWEAVIPGEPLADVSNFELLLSKEKDIILARDLIGCYCFDFRGKMLWHERRLNGIEYLHLAGLSQVDGSVLLSSVMSDYKGISVSLRNRTGLPLWEGDLRLGDSESFAGNWGTVADVFQGLFLLRFVIINAEKRMTVTAICIEAPEGWRSHIVEGLWYYLPSENLTGTLIGFSENSMEIAAYYLELGRVK